MVTDEEIREFMADAPDVRTVAQRARVWIDVMVHRASPESCYVPMAGDRR
jgi:hypothetical protein